MTIDDGEAAQAIVAWVAAQVEAMGIRDFPPAVREWNLENAFWVYLVAAALTAPRTMTRTATG